ncbi:hypothetical protein [Catenulispora pinisilvae]|uniref:hypothetical protein n=1 Tax=Catenulispora pinisilvae TaxID=2705253 RepID=UPI0018916BA0|nr:hypothetical protein [Catenulispora pinisilvae]
MMIAIEAQSAVRALYTKCAATPQDYWQQRCERALDECLRNPLRATPWMHQVRNALANAKKVLDQRDEIIQAVPFDDVADTYAPTFTDAFAAIDIMLWLERTNGITAPERAILQDLAAGEDAESLADRANVPVTSMRQKISRARSSARRAWTTDMAV